MNKDILQPLLKAVLQNDARGGTNLALLHIIHQNNLAKLEPSLLKYLAADELFYELKNHTIVNHSPAELSLLRQDKYLVPLLHFATGRAYNNTVLRIQKDYGVSKGPELNKLKGIISNMYLEGCQDIPDINKIKALSKTLLTSLNSDDRLMLTSQDPEQVLHTIHDSISSSLHHAISQEIKAMTNIKDVTFKGDEVLWRGLKLNSNVDIEKFLGITHIVSMHAFHIPLSEDDPFYPCHRVCTSAGLSTPMNLSLVEPDQYRNQPMIGYLLEIRPKNGQKATFLCDHIVDTGLEDLEFDFDMINPEEVYAAYTVKGTSGDNRSDYEIQQVILNKRYVARESDDTPDGSLHFSAGDKLVLTDPAMSEEDEGYVPGVYQFEFGELVSAKNGAATKYSFKEQPAYQHFKPAVEKYFAEALLHGGSCDDGDGCYIPPKIDAAIADANRQETAAQDAALYPYTWPHSDEFSLL